MFDSCGSYSAGYKSVDLSFLSIIVVPQKSVHNSGLLGLNLLLYISKLMEFTCWLSISDKHM